MSTRTTSAWTVPGVPGLHARGWPMIGITRGSTMWAWKRTSDQPRPNAKRSSRTFSTPHERSRSAAHSRASSMAGVPVTRGP